MDNVDTCCEYVSSGIRSGFVLVGLTFCYQMMYYQKLPLYVRSHDTVRFQWSSIVGRQIGINVKEAAQNLLSEFTVVFSMKV
jgi:hypothetical protein